MGSVNKATIDRTRPAGAKSHMKKQYTGIAIIVKNSPIKSKSFKGFPHIQARKHISPLKYVAKPRPIASHDITFISLSLNLTLNFHL